MKAIICEKPGILRVVDRPMATVGEGEVLVRMKRVGVCGTDIHAFKGDLPFIEYPRILGHELAAEVVEISPGARAEAEKAGFKTGDQVAILPYLRCGTCIACRQGKTNCCTTLKCLGVHCDGGMQEFFSIHPFYIVPAPGVSADQLATVECFAIGFHGVRRAQPAPGELALVAGAGPIGIGAMHGLRAAGARVIAMDINEKRLSYCTDVVKVDYTVNPAKIDAEKFLLELTGGDRPTLVMDATGNPRSMMDCFGFMASGGRIVYLSLINADITFADGEFHRKETTLLSSRNATKEDFAKVIACIASGQVDTTGFVTHQARPEEAVNALADWIKPESGAIKAVIEF